MKKHLLILLLLSGFLAISQAQAQKKLTSLAPTETYPDDEWLARATPKRAMVIVAHDDDSAPMAGTIAQLNAAGWEIMHLCFAGEEEERRERHRAGILKIADHAGFIPMAGKDYRNDLDTVQYPYLAIPRERFSLVFNQAEVEKHLLRSIDDFQPSVIFTLDDEIGGYGHPDHVFISALVRDLARSGKIPVRRIYQNTYTPHMEEQIVVQRLGKLLEKWGYPNTFELAKQIYGVDGMPDPTVQINILDQAAAKMAHLRGYAESERKNLRKFVPYFEDYPAEKYFKVFDREFFRVLEF